MQTWEDPNAAVLPAEKAIMASCFGRNSEGANEICVGSRAVAVVCSQIMVEHVTIAYIGPCQQMMVNASPVSNSEICLCNVYSKEDPTASFTFLWDEPSCVK